jgi:hypothetical protein
MVSEKFDGSRAEELLATIHAERDLIGHGLFGQAESLRDGALGEAFDFVEKEDFTAAFRQGGERLTQEFSLFHPGQNLGDTRPII